MMQNWAAIKEESIQVGEMFMMQRLKVQFKSPLNELVLVKNVILYFKWFFMQIQLTTAEMTIVKKLIMTMDTATKAADVIQIVNKTEEVVCFILKCSYLFSPIKRTQSIQGTINTIQSSKTGQIVSLIR